MLLILKVWQPKGNMNRRRFFSVITALIAGRFQFQKTTSSIPRYRQLFAKTIDGKSNRWIVDRRLVDWGVTSKSEHLALVKELETDDSDLADKYVT